MAAQNADLVRQIEALEQQANDLFERGYEVLVRVNAMKAKLVAPVFNAEVTERVLMARDKLVAFGAAPASAPSPTFAIVAYYIHTHPGLSLSDLRKFTRDIPRNKIMVFVGPNLRQCTEGYFFSVDGPTNVLSLYPPLFGDEAVAAAYDKIKRGP